jgi:methionyl-tRNA synthetase
MSRFYVTTPIYYVTAKPHLGSLYSTLLADVSARFNKLQGKEVFFLTGTDEHGQKVAQAAENNGKSPKAFVDGFIDQYKQTWQNYNIAYSHFIRTTDEYHVKAVQKWLQNLIDTGDIYKAKYEGRYCTPCETFVTEKDQAEDSGDTVKCGSCNRETIAVAEDSYFFKLSAYEDRLLKFFADNPNFIIPKEKANEVISFVKSGLRDLCISRSTIKWGIPFPGDEQHVTYVWADALNNYITGIGYGDDSRAAEFAKWWPADLQVLGKDIIRFHAVYWPAFLMASGMPLPKHLLVHGWLKIADQKMSKSLGNGVDPDVLCKEYGADVVRYYLTSQMAITQDSNFGINLLRTAVSADLANSLGNLLSRSVSLALKNKLEVAKKPQDFVEQSAALLALIKSTASEYTKLMDECSYHMAIAAVNKLVARANAYFHEQQPWKIVKDQPELFNEVIWATCAVLEAVSILLQPVMPTKMVELQARIGSQIKLEGDVLAKVVAGEASSEFKLEHREPLFMKYDKLEPVEAPQVEEVKKDANSIEFDDFLKVELIVGTITVCDEVPKSKKLLRMDVDFGDKGMRQVLSGIKEFYSPADMVGRQGVFVFNLKPRKIMGMESQGMLLSVADGDNLKLAAVADKVTNGSRLG